MNERDATCTGKVRYFSRVTAKRAAKLAARRNVKGLTPYVCVHCGLHHLGHPPGQATYLRREWS